MNGEEMSILSEESGIIPRVINNVFDKLKVEQEQDSTSTFKVYCSYIEVYV